MEKIILKEKSIIPACDVPLKLYERIVKDTSNIDDIGAYKVGFELGLNHSLPKVVEVARRYNTKPIIYDHQKAGTDIPNTGKKFAKIMKNAGIDAVILLPQAGPETERAWIEAAFEEGLGVIVGGLMTHSHYIRSEGGYIADEAILEMYLNAAEVGVSDFVVPGNKPSEIKIIKERLEQRGVSPTFYAPGFVGQGGSISNTATVAGNYWHAIIGRAIYEADDITETAINLTKQL